MKGHDVTMLTFLAFANESDDLAEAEGNDAGVFFACDNASSCTIHDKRNQEVLRNCYQNVRWSEVESFCGCSSWYGFVGEFCDISTGPTAYFKSISIVLSVWSFLLCCFFLFELIKYFVFKIRAKKKARTQFNMKRFLFSVDTVFYAALFCFFSCTFLLVNGTIHLRGLFDPRRVELETFTFLTSTSQQVGIINGNLATTALHLVFTFFILGSMQISLSWVDLATTNNAASFFEKGYHRGIKRFKLFVKTMTVFYLIVGVVLLVIDFINALFVLFPIMILILVVLFYKGRRVFEKVFQGAALVSRSATTEFGSSSKTRTFRKMNSAKKSMELVKRSSLLHIILLSFLCVGSILFPILFVYYQKLIPVGGFNYVLFIRDSCVIAGLILMTSNAQYIYIVSKRLRKNHLAVLSRATQRESYRSRESLRRSSPKQNRKTNSRTFAEQELQELRKSKPKENDFRSITFARVSRNFRSLRKEQ